MTFFGIHFAGARMACPLFEVAVVHTIVVPKGLPMRSPFAIIKREEAINIHIVNRDNTNGIKEPL